jgi:hypothetical protein
MVSMRVVRALLDLCAMRRFTTACAALPSHASLLTQQASYATRVRTALMQAGALRSTSIQPVSRERGVCERTLRRRLTDERTSYEAVADEVYSAGAKSWLRDGRRSIKETAAVPQDSAQ